MPTLDSLITKLEVGILNPIINLLFILATILFLLGGIHYVIGSQGNETQLQKGRQIMVWGIIGMTVMASAWGIVRIICTFFGTCR